MVHIYLQNMVIWNNNYTTSVYVSPVYFSERFNTVVLIYDSCSIALQDMIYGYVSRGLCVPL